jgi:hypothetical protein
VVPENGGTCKTCPRKCDERQHPVLSAKIQEYLQPLDEQCKGLVHQPPVVVGTPDSGLVYRKHSPLNPPEGGTWGFVVAENEEEARKLGIGQTPLLGRGRGRLFSYVRMKMHSTPGFQAGYGRFRFSTEFVNLRMTK